MEEELFRFVAVRDVQRSARPKVLRALTWIPGSDSLLVQALRNASPDTANVVVAADEFRKLPIYQSAPSATPQLVRDVDSRLLTGSAPVEIREVIDGGLRSLTSSAVGTRLDEMFDASAVVEARMASQDSYLAALFSATATEQERVWLDRVVTIWAVIDHLVRQLSTTAAELRDLLRHRVVVLPAGIAITSADAATSTGAGAATGSAAADEPAPSLTRYQSLRDAWLAVKDAVLTEVPLIAFDANIKDLSNLNSSRLSGKVDSTADATLVKEGILFADTPLVELPDVVAARANEALHEHLTAAALSPGQARRAAVVDELVRRRGWEPSDGPAADDPLLPVKSRFGTARLLKSPVIGELKVVRQTLAGYELGEIAHVENLLAKERLARRHEVVDVAETEQLTVDVIEETHLHDMQTTTRSELARETSKQVATSDAFNVGGTVTASYGPYFSATATGGYASSTSRTEATTTSQRFSRDVTDRATDSIMTRTESLRRTLNRRTVTETNTHSMTGPDSGNASAVYRWVNKRYCAQMYNYGLRVLLEIGVSDPSANYRWAAALRSDLDVEVDPPPQLVAPLGGELSPSVIDETNWQALSARFRVAEFPPPPRYLITSPAAYSVEPPSAPATGGATPQPASTYKVSKELKIPAGYQSLCFVAGVLADGMQFAPMKLAPLQVARVQILLALAVAPPRSLPVPFDELLATVNLWVGWDPTAPAPFLSSREYTVLSALLPVLVDVARQPGGSGDIPIVSSLRYFLTAVTGVGTVSLLVGATAVPIYGGAVRAGGLVTAPQVIAGTDETVLPVGYAAQSSVGAAITLEVLSVASADMRSRWQLDAYNAILAAHASWEADFRAAVAQAEIQGGVEIEGRNPGENTAIIAAELKRSVIAMLGGVSLPELVSVEPGNPQRDPSTGQPTPPKVNLEKAIAAARSVGFYEQAFEWQNMSHIFYPYFWTGRGDWPEALQRRDADPIFQDFLRAGAARIVLPIRMGWEATVGSRLAIKIPAWPNEPQLSTAPVPIDDPFLEISEEIRDAQDPARGGVPSGKPWPVALPTTLVAFDGTPMPTYPTPCNPHKPPKQTPGSASGGDDERG